jgi:ATP-dependent HslUV protease ATP-binding subunit HslU
MTPQEIVYALDQFIIGQKAAKKAVAVALRNRWRRKNVPEPLRHEITPKNILMIGPTGVGKTEIARRLAKLAKAPFIKIEATKFTEVGYVGRDVDSIIRDLLEIAIKEEKAHAIEKHKQHADALAEEKVLDILMPGTDGDQENSTRQKFRKMLREGQLNDKEIDIELSSVSKMEIFAPPGMEDLTQQLQNVFKGLGDNKRKTCRVKVCDAMRLLAEEEASRLVNDDDIRANAIKNVEQNGIVFLDEVDKIASRSDGHQSEVSRAGVQRDLLPLVEGTAVNTKHGVIHTDHILFIASGAFHLSRPSDLIPELQGRFPIRVELSSLSVDDFQKILMQENAGLIKQYEALLINDGVNLVFEDGAIQKIAEIAWSVNEKTENIGARRLYTVLEKLLEDISFEMPQGLTTIDAAYVENCLGSVSEKEDLARYVL